MLNLFQQVQQHAQQRPAAIALWHYQGKEQITSTTFSELALMARYFASAFSQSVPDTTLIPMYLSKSAAGVAALIGAIGAGKGFIYLNKRLRAPQINKIVYDASAKLALIDSAGVMNLVTTLTSDAPIAHIHWWHLADQKTTSSYERALNEMRRLSSIEDWFFNEHKDEKIPVLKADPQRIGCCLFTSGSTGTPKGVLIAESDLQARAVAEIKWFGLSPDDVLLSVLPFSFDVGLNQLLSALTVGCPLVLLESWLPNDILNAVAQLKVTGISGVPALWLDMLKAQHYFDTNQKHASLRYLTVSGGDLSLQHLEQLLHLAPNVGIFKTYGQTEAFRASALRPHEFNIKRGSVGLPFEGVKIYVVREDGSLCNANEIGEIVHTGLGVMLGYLDDYDPEKKHRPNPYSNHQHHDTYAIFTGDLGYLDEEGYLFITGRRDSLLKIAGNRIYPKEIVNQLLQLNSVAEAEVIGIKTLEDDTRLFAFVVPVEDIAITPLKIRQQLRNILPAYMIPQEVIILNAIPRTASGKTDYPTLSKLVEKSLNIN
ncbi:MAG: AMP-binding protein [Pseudomonadota bacterium]|nr:AMP-binding protein [Pseudomonadota bacterium]